MAKVTVGILNVFNHDSQEWLLYKGRLEQWFLANDITETQDKSGEKRRAILLSSLSENTFRLVRDLALPSDVATLSYEKVIGLLDGHFKTKKCGFAERHKFFGATQEPTESFASWAARVRGLAIYCAFPANFLNDALRDRFVLGMVCGKERDRLFSEPMEGLTLEKAVQLAESVRCAREGARQPAPTAAPAAAVTTQNALDVHKVTARGSKEATANTSRGRENCSVCGYNNHSAKICRFKNYTCKLCGEKGHLKRVCSKVAIKHNFLQCCEDVGDDGKRLIFNIRSINGEPMQESVLVNNVKLCFEIDTGSAVTAIADTLYYKYFSEHPLRINTKTLQSYSGGSIPCLGIISLPFHYRGCSENIDVYIIKGGGPPLLGRDFLSKFKLEISNIYQCQTLSETDRLIKKYSALFSDKLGCCKDIEVNLCLKKNVTPVYCKARQLPFALRPKVEQELDRLVSLGIIEPVTYSEYASPVVPVLKHDGSIRLCADYSGTINKQLEIEKYPLPRIDELFSKLHGGVHFTKLDLSSAYNQLKLQEQSQMLTCINTVKGLYKYKRLVFGLASAPAIFQRCLENILTGVGGVLQFLDDILITGSSKEEHLERLENVFKRLQAAGLVLRKDKCSFFQESVTYLGYIIDKHGLRKSPEKIKAILEAKRPQNVSELKSFLGMVNYYRSFIKNASNILHPFHLLLQKNNNWVWEPLQEEAFCKIKNILTSDNILAHFDPRATLILTVDAAPHGLGAVLSQIGKDGNEKPISYASRSLNSAEKQYSQIQKEATAIIFGVRKYHQYLYGRDVPFVLRTDHKPLLSIFRPDKCVPEVTANRLQRYALFLSAYNYVIEYVKSAHNCADFLSRSVAHGPVSNSVISQSADRCTDADAATYLNFVWQNNSMALITLEEIQRDTISDTKLKQIVEYVNTGWPSKIKNKELKPFFDCRTELSVEKGCLLRGHKLVIPDSLKNRVITELHSGHLGIAKMKIEARSRFWWPGMAASLQSAADACAVCAQLRPAPARAPLTPWPYPAEPWARIHLDFLGPVSNKVYLICVDAYSKWVEAYDVSTGYGTRVVLEKLCDLMSRFGLCRTICTDNGTSFVSSEFEGFCRDNGIVHLTTPTYHPASNGQAESYVKIIKKAIKSIILSGTNSRDLNIKLKEFLFNYRNSVHSATGRSPAQILFGKNIRSRLDLINPLSPPPSDAALAEIVKEKQCSQVSYYRGRRNIDFENGSLVLVKAHYRHNTCWEIGKIIKKLGKSAYIVQLSRDSRTLKRHKNQIYELKGEKNDTLFPQTQDEGRAPEEPRSVRGNEEVPPITLSLPGSTEGAPSTTDTPVADDSVPSENIGKLPSDSDSRESAKDNGVPESTTTDPAAESSDTAGVAASVDPPDNQQLHSRILRPRPRPPFLRFTDSN